MAWEKDDAWNKKSNTRRPRDRGRHAPPEKPDATEASTWERSKRSAEKRHKRRKLGWIAAVIAVVLLLIVALLPTIASAIAPGIIASAGSDAITGRVTVQSVKLSWLGGQRIRGLALYDTDDTRRSDLNITADKGLLALAFAGGDFGTITLSGSIDASANAAGEPFTTNTVGPASSAPASTKPTAPPSAAPAIPAGLKAALKLDRLQLTYANPAVPSPTAALRLDDIVGTINIDANAESKIDIRAALARKPAGEAAFQNAGTLSIDSTATGLADADGTITPDAMTFETTIKAEQVQTLLIEAFADQEGRLPRALGDAFTCTATASGTPKQTAATLTLEAPAATLSAPLTIDLDARTISSASDITARLNTAMLSQILPNRDALVGPDAEVHVTEFPEINITISALRAPIPETGSSLDLRRAGAHLTAQIGALAATLKDPTTGAPRAVGFEPATITLAAADLTQPVTLTTAIDTLVDRARSGTLAVNLTAAGLLNEQGAFNTAKLPTIDGSIRAQRLALAAFQPIAQAAGFDLVRTIGSTADFAIEAAQAGERTNIVITGNADHATINGALALAGSTLSLADNEGRTASPLTIRIDRPDAAIAGYLAAAGVDITGASGLLVELSDLRLDTEQIAAGNLGETAVELRTTIERIDATLRTSGEAVSIQNASITIDTPALASGISANASNAFALNGAPAGSIRMGLIASDLLDSNGALKKGIPENFNGTLDVVDVRTAALAAFVPLPQLDLPRDLGPLLNAQLGATPGASAGITAVTLAVESKNLKGSGAFDITPDRIRGPGNALTLELAAAGPILEAFLNKPATADTPAGPLKLTATTPGKATITVRDLDIPIDPGAIQASGKASINASLAALAMRGPSGDAGTIDRLAAALTLTPGTDPTIIIDGTISQPASQASAKPGVVAGRFTIANAFAPLDAQGRPAIAPNGELTATDLPLALARLLDISFPAVPVEGQTATTLATALTNAAGPVATIRLTTARETDPARAADAPLEAALAINAGPHTIDAKSSLIPSSNPAAPGQFVLNDLSADAKLAINNATFRSALAIAAPAAPAGMSISAPGTLELQTRTDRAAPGGPILRTDLTLSPTTIAGLTAPAATNTSPAAPPRTIAPMSLAGTAGVTMPIALLSDPTTSHAVALTADFKGTERSQAGPGREVIAITAKADTTLVNSAPAGATTAELRVSSQETAWIDALAGMNGLLTAALGERVQIRGNATATAAQPGGPLTTKATASIDAPNLRTATPAAFTLTPDALSLDRPLVASWTMTPALVSTLAPTQPGKMAQVALAAPANFTINANTLVLPMNPEGAASKAIANIDLKATAPALPLRFTDGATYPLTDLAIALASMPDAGKGTLNISANSEENKENKAFAITSTVSGLPQANIAFDPAKVTLDGFARFNALPMRLVDALAAGDGQLVDLLGDSVNIQSTLTQLPQPGGTIAFRATSPQANARYAATVRPDPKDPNALALIADAPVRAEITHFDYSFAGKKISVLPVFGSVRKIEKTHQPATVTLTQLITPADGEITHIAMRGTIDPGVVEYEFEQGLAALLKITKQRSQSRVGERLDPFTIAMADGIARFTDLAVPLGEFTMTAKGSFDLVRNRESITIGIPAGAFAGEVIGNLPGATGGLINKDIIVPVRREGPIGAQNQWKPDFEAVLKDLFSPQNILDNVIKGGLKDLLGGG